MELRNETDLVFTDISSEQYRKYIFPTNPPLSVEVVAPKFLNISADGHRILDASGECHYIPNGWINLTWRPNSGAAHFVK